MILQPVTAINGLEKKGIDVEKVLEDLANEIASKNAHELSKIIDDPSIISFIKKSK